LRAICAQYTDTDAITLLHAANKMDLAAISFVVIAAEFRA